MKCELICVDIDGTLITDEKKLMPEVRDSLRSAAAQGIQIALVSGRMPAGVSNLEQELGVPCVKVCNAGTYILLGDKCISAEYLLPEILRNVYVEFAKKNNLPLWIFQGKQWFVTAIDHYIEREIDIIRYQPKIVDAETLAEQWQKEKKGPSKLVLAAKPELIRQLAREIEARHWEGVDIACSADVLLEIFPKGSNKGTALRTICNKLGIDPKHTIAFGDHELDIPLIEAAGVGVAMGNAIDALKEKADFVTKTNNEAGIAYALDYLLSSRRV